MRVHGRDGLDVRQASTVVSVRERSGGVIARTVLFTDAHVLTQQFSAMRGSVRIALDVAVRVIRAVPWCDPRDFGISMVAQGACSRHASGGERMRAFRRLR
jgi:hypothetical protein